MLTKSSWKTFDGNIVYHIKMWHSLWIVLVVVLGAASQLLVLDPKKLALLKSKSAIGSKPDSKRLLLTPLLEEGKVATSRKLARVHGGPFPADILSYSGYFTVDKKYNSNMFFWFFPAENVTYPDAPVVVWLQGGPGGSSMYGLFTELGPFRISAVNETLEIIPYAWTKNYSLLFIDNPVGTGFSFTDHEDGLARNETQVGDNLYSLLVQFYTMFPELQDRDLYINGESYAGKYIPAIGYTIHKRNPTADIKINLKGLIIGNGLSDPITSAFHYSDFVFQLGLIDRRIRDEMREVEERGRENIREGNYMEARGNWGHAIGMFASSAHYGHLYNYLYTEEQHVGGDYVTFLRRPDVRKALHVGKAYFQEINGYVYEKLLEDTMQSVKPWVEELLDSDYRVVYYSGQMDIIVGYPMSTLYYESLEFKDAQEYRNARRKPWYVGDDLAGYSRTGGNFTEIMVRNAGHMVPSDQPEWALNLMNKITSGEEF
uniref:Carboxypeptidase n=1 Tax=Timema shepardi TaxID=629360 RepID=A0A7R9AXS0_TIMSH|nr:unnamed protein product [Timema shepardi]